MRVGVLQLVDSLAVGGLERVAVNLANLLPEDRFESHLCCSRTGGPLRSTLQPHVKCLELNRRHTFDLAAIRKLRRYIERNNIRIVQAHGSSLFLAAALSLRGASTRYIWHVHFGKLQDGKPAPWHYRAATSRMHLVLAVSQTLVDWVRTAVRYPGDRVQYLPNFVVGGRVRPGSDAERAASGKHIVCVANLRPEKDHLTLLRAFAIVRGQVPDARLSLVGSTDNPETLQGVEAEIGRLNLGTAVKVLGLRSDVPEILAQADVGVISSYTEGLPLALLEYCAAGVPCVVTDVGQCREVLDGGRLGLVVPPSDPTALAKAMGEVLTDPAARDRWGTPAKDWVNRRFGAGAQMERLCGAYDTVLGRD